MLVSLDQIIIPPGDRLLVHSLNWEDYERILEELGERPAMRLSYSQGTLEIMTP